MLRDRAYLGDILEAARLATDYVAGKSRAEFLRDVQCQDAVIRRLEIIGEAARKISEETRGIYPELPWDDMAGMRNFLIHEYGGIDLGIVWDTVQLDLKPIIATLDRVLLSDGLQ